MTINNTLDPHTPSLAKSTQDRQTVELFRLGRVTEKLASANVVLPDRSLEGVKFVLDSITNLELAPDSVGPSELQADSVGPSEIQSQAVGNLELGVGAVDDSKVSNVGVGKLVGLIGTAMLGAGAATSLPFASGTTASPTNAVANFAVMPEMTVATNPSYARFAVFGCDLWGSAGAVGELGIADSAVTVGHSLRQVYIPSNGVPFLTGAVIPAGGNGTVQGYWRAIGGSLTANAVRRFLAVIELRR